MLSQTVPVKAIQTAVHRTNGFEEQAAKVIQKYSLISSAACLVPLHLVDMLATTVTQSLMVKDLCQLYNVPYAGHLQNIAFWSATGSLVTKGITEAVSSILKNRKNEFGGIDITGAAIAGIYTATVGEFYKLHLRDGGTLEDVNLADFADYFLDEIKRGDISMSTFTNPAKLLSHLMA